MSDILLILSLLCVLKAMLTLSLIPNRWVWIGFGAVCAGFVWLTHDYALEQNKLALEALFEGQKILTDVSLVVMLDLLLTLGLCQSALNRSVDSPNRRLFGILGYIPPLLMFPVVYYAQVNMFFSFVGVDFVFLSGVLSAAVLVVMVGGTWFVRRLLPDAGLRIELTAILELLIFVLAICCTIFHPSALIYTNDAPIDYRTLLFTIGVVASLFAAGWGWQIFKTRKQNKIKS